MLRPTPHPLTSAAPAAAPAALPLIWPLILTASIALLSVLPIALGIAALIWAIADLFNLPTPVIAGADLLVIAAVVALSVPVFVRIFRQERHDAGEARTLRNR